MASLAIWATLPDAARERVILSLFGPHTRANQTKRIPEKELNYGLSSSRPPVPRKQPARASTAADVVTPDAGSHVDELATLIADLKSKELTTLQKRQIAKRFQGRRVQWSGYVGETTAIGTGPSRQFLLIWTPESQINDFLPDNLAATFSREHEADIVALRKRDFVVIEGTVNIAERGYDVWVPELEDCTLVSVKVN